MRTRIAVFPESWSDKGKSSFEPTISVLREEVCRSNKLADQKHSLIAKSEIEVVADGCVYEILRLGCNCTALGTCIFVQVNEIGADRRDNVFVAELGRALQKFPEFQVTELFPVVGFVGWKITRRLPGLLPSPVGNWDSSY